MLHNEIYKPLHTLREIRQTLGYTQKEISDVLEISLRQYQYYETKDKEKITPFYIHLAMLALLLLKTGVMDTPPHRRPA